MSFTVLSTRVSPSELVSARNKISAICPVLLQNPPADEVTAAIVLKFFGIDDPAEFLAYLDMVGKDISDPSNLSEILTFNLAPIPTFESKADIDFPALGSKPVHAQTPASTSQAKKLIESVCNTNGISADDRYVETFASELSAFVKATTWVNTDGSIHFSNVTCETGEFDFEKYAYAGEILKFWINATPGNTKLHYRLARTFASIIGVFVECAHSGAIYTPASTYSYAEAFMGLVKGDYGIYLAVEDEQVTPTARKFFGDSYVESRANFLPFSEISSMIYEMSKCDNRLVQLFRWANRETVLNAYTEHKNFLEMCISNNHKILNVDEVIETMKTFRRQILEIGDDYLLPEVDGILNSLSSVAAH